MNKITAFLLITALFGTFAAAVEVDNPYGEADLLAQPRASRKHDRVTITINENTSAKNEATTETTKETSTKWSLSKLFKITKDADGDIIAQAFPDTRKPELDLSSTREHTGEGETESKNIAKTILSGEVIQVMPNGHLVVEAISSITVNEEERSVVFTGRVDPADLDSKNNVDAKYIIEKKVKFVGKGDVAEAVRRGWLAKVFDFLSPF
ncbi:MAG: flagellar basal body L-ring protein FlgH [Planctomycetota bacterium]